MCDWLKLTRESKRALVLADEEPFGYINRRNGISSDLYLSLLHEIEDYLPEFEDAVGMRGARVRIGERLVEAVNAGRTTVKDHLKMLYFSCFAIEEDTAYILIENYELTRIKEWLIKTRYHAYNFTVLRFLLTRQVHEDTHSHVHKTDYSALYSDLAEKASDSTGHSMVSMAPLYVREKEEVIARRMQRFAINAFLKRYYEHDTDRYSILGVPLFLPPNSEVIEDIKRTLPWKVEFKHGFLSVYRKILDEYVGAITKSEAEIYETARDYLASRTDQLIEVVQKCLRGDYSGLRTIEPDIWWAPGRDMKI